MKTPTKTLTCDTAQCRNPVLHVLHLIIGMRSTRYNYGRPLQLPGGGEFWEGEQLDHMAKPYIDGHLSGYRPVKMRWRTRHTGRDRLSAFLILARLWTAFARQKCWEALSAGKHWQLCRHESDVTFRAHNHIGGSVISNACAFNWWICLRWKTNRYLPFCFSLWDFSGNCVIGSSVSSPEDTTLYIWLFHYMERGQIWEQTSAAMQYVSRGSNQASLYS